MEHAVALGTCSSPAMFWATSVAGDGTIVKARKNISKICGVCDVVLVLLVDLTTKYC